MKDKINVAELLKDCPNGMELDCTMWDDCTFDGIEDVGYIDILVKTPSGRIRLTKEGCYIRQDDYAKCVIYPKGKTTWEGFHRPFKDGDVIHIRDEYSDITYTYVAIFKQIEKGGKVYSHCFYDYEYDEFNTHDYLHDDYSIRFATEEEKQKLFQAIRANGYKWNEETKTLDKLIEPKFKVGDKIKKKGLDIVYAIEITAVTPTIYTFKNGGFQYIETTDKNYELVSNKLVKPKFKVGDIIQDIDAYKVKITEINIGDECYGYESIIAKGIGSIPFNEQEEWKLVPNKFDITTLVPFESRVLVRHYDSDVWKPAIYGVVDSKKHYSYVVGGSYFRQCIPYDGNEHLLGTNDDCDEFYKTWK